MALLRKVSDKPLGKPRPFCAKHKNVNNGVVLGEDAVDFVVVVEEDFAADEVVVVVLEDGDPRHHMAWDEADHLVGMALPDNTGLRDKGFTTNVTDSSFEQKFRRETNRSTP